jgi:hypothetical protein
MQQYEVIEESYYEDSPGSSSGAGGLGRRILIAVLMTFNPFSPLNWVTYIACLFITRYAMYYSLYSKLYSEDPRKTSTGTIWKRSAYLALILYIPIAIVLNIIAAIIIRTLLGIYPPTSRFV